MEQTSCNELFGTRRTTLREPISNHPMRVTGANLFVKSQIPVVPLAPLLLTSTTPEKCTKTPKTQSTSVSSASEIARRNGVQSPLSLSGPPPSYRISPVVSSGSRDLRGRRYGFNTCSTNSSHTAVVPSVPLSVCSATPIPSTMTASSSSSSSVLLQGAGGGRRIFKRIGMNCVYELHGDNSPSIELKNPRTPDNAAALNHVSLNPSFVGSGDTDNSSNNNGSTPFVRPWLRQQSVLSGSLLEDLTKEVKALQKTPLRDSSAVKSISEGNRVQNFTGTHRCRHNCPHHGVIIESDLYVADIPHKESSLHLQSYSLTDFEPTPEEDIENNDDGINEPQNHCTEVKHQPCRRNSALNGGRDEFIVVAPTPKSSITLSRTLSNLRAKSRSAALETVTPLRQSSRGVRVGTREMYLETVSTDTKSQRRGVALEMWSNALGSSSRSSSLDSVESSIRDDGSCCLCCRPSSKGKRCNFGFTESPGKNKHLDSTEEPHVVTYNNFISAEDIPVVSVCSFRRSFGFGKGSDSEWIMGGDENL